MITTAETLDNPSASRSLDALPPFFENEPSVRRDRRFPWSARFCWRRQRTNVPPSNDKELAVFWIEEKGLVRMLNIPGNVAVKVCYAGQLHHPKAEPCRVSRL